MNVFFLQYFACDIHLYEYLVPYHKSHEKSKSFHSVSNEFGGPLNLVALCGRIARIMPKAGSGNT